MKKSLLYGGAAFLLTLSACSDNNYSQNQTVNIQTLNIVTSVKDGVSTVSKGIYGFNLKITNSSMTGIITGANINAEGATLNFTSTELPYLSTGFDVIFNNVVAQTTGNISYEITNGKFIISPYFNYPGQLGINSPYNPSAVSPYVLIASYNIGPDYYVKTFPENSFFSGETTTSYSFQGIPDTYKTDSILYGLIINAEAKTATLIMYNAKFSNVPAEPIKAQINLKDLPVNFNNGSISINAKDVIPYVVEGGMETPYENFIFNSIEFFTTSGDLTTCRFNYTVANMYQGSFSGEYVDTSYLKQ